MDNDLNPFDSYEPCSGKLSDDHEQYGYCQAGTSVEFHKVTFAIEVHINCVKEERVRLKEDANISLLIQKYVT